MAQKLEITFVDDLDGTEAEGTTRFGIDGRDFEIDLSASNRARLEKALIPFIGAARKVSASRRRGAAPTAKGDQRDVRAWARAQGMKVSDRGRISAAALSQYEAAH